YSLLPDTASYATRAIRYNTVTVQVDGANVGTQYHAAWSPDIKLDKSNSPVYTDEEARAIITHCPIGLLVDTANPGAWKAYSVGAYAPATLTGCGSDAATSVRPRIIAGTVPPLDPAVVYWTAADNGSALQYNGETFFEGNQGRSWMTFAIAEKQNQVRLSSGGAQFGDFILSDGSPIVVTPPPNDGTAPANPQSFNLAAKIYNNGDSDLVVTTDTVSGTAQISATGVDSSGDPMFTYPAYTTASFAITWVAEEDSGDRWVARNVRVKYDVYRQCKLFIARSLRGNKYFPPDLPDTLVMSSTAHDHIYTMTTIPQEGQVYCNNTDPVATGSLNVKRPQGHTDTDFLYIYGRSGNTYVRFN
ncbi:hypothetical protein AB2X99_004604, partial [Salmonella enterica]